MYRYSYLIIFVLLLVAGIGFGILAQYNNENDSSISPSATPSVFLSPQVSRPDKNGEIVLHVQLAAQKMAVKSVAVALSYDPTSVKVMSISPEGIFAKANVTKQKIDATGGRCCHKTGSIIYALTQTSPQQNNTTMPIITLHLQALTQGRPTGVSLVAAQVDEQSVPLSQLLQTRYNSTILLEKGDRIDEKR